MARFLLDTHAVLWALAEPGMLSRPARMALEDARNEVFVSVFMRQEHIVRHASAWRGRTSPRCFGESAVVDDPARLDPLGDSRRRAASVVHCACGNILRQGLWAHGEPIDDPAPWTPTVR